MQFKYFLAVLPALVLAQEETTTGPIDAATSVISDIAGSASSVASSVSESITSDASSSASASASSEAIQSSIESIQSSASSEIESIQSEVASATESLAEEATGTASGSESSEAGAYQTAAPVLAAGVMAMLAAFLQPHMHHRPTSHYVALTSEGTTDGMISRTEEEIVSVNGVTGHNTSKIPHEWTVE
ncbi:uncharacterized protein RHO25_006653 [Cercospora beticola]|uniref:Uncharacterized protein n=1 Tax=Cercospora beticola TaxID=122368 RepID=A0ABZ0NR41_CERBT|nr:hypothetical protein RHO25_006653 [Cercospora beticola]